MGTEPVGVPGGRNIGRRRPGVTDLAGDCAPRGVGQRQDGLRFLACAGRLLAHAVDHEQAGLGRESGVGEHEKTDEATYEHGAAGIACEHREHNTDPGDNDGRQANKHQRGTGTEVRMESITERALTPSSSASG